MADISTLSSNASEAAERTVSFTRHEVGIWQTVEQAAVALGLSVRTVNRHISAQKLKSRLMDGRREVFVADVADGTPDESSGSQLADETPATPEAPAPPAPCAAPASATSNLRSDEQSHPTLNDGPDELPDSFLNLETALAMAHKMGDTKADRQVELAVRAYQTLTQTIEIQAASARKRATIAWCMVGVLSVGAAGALVWTASRVTRAEADAQHLKQTADEAQQRADSQAKQLADSQQQQEKDLADMRQRLSDAQQRASRAEGRADVYEQMQLHQPASRPTSAPSWIDNLTKAFGQ